MYASAEATVLELQIVLPNQNRAGSYDYRVLHKVDCSLHSTEPAVKQDFLSRPPGCENCPHFNKTAASFYGMSSNVQVRSHMSFPKSGPP